MGAAIYKTEHRPTRVKTPGTIIVDALPKRVGPTSFPTIDFYSQAVVVDFAYFAQGGFITSKFPPAQMGHLLPSGPA